MSSGSDKRTGAPHPGDRDAAAQTRARNLRTALVLLSVAAVFFAGIVVNRWLFAQ